MSTIVSYIAPIVIAICVTFLVIQIVNLIEKKRVIFAYILLVTILLVFSTLTYMVTVEYERGYQAAIEDASLVEVNSETYVLEFRDGEHVYDYD